MGLGVMTVGEGDIDVRGGGEHERDTTMMTTTMMDGRKWRERDVAAAAVASRRCCAAITQPTQPNQQPRSQPLLPSHAPAYASPHPQHACRTLPLSTLTRLPPPLNAPLTPPTSGARALALSRDGCTSRAAAAVASARPSTSTGAQ